MLGGYHVNGLVRVEVDKVALGQLVGKASANDLGAVKAENGIHNGVGSVIGNQLLSNCLCLGKTGLLGGYVNIIIDMAMTGCKVSLGHAKKQISVFGSDFIRFFGWHSENPFFFIISQPPWAVKKKMEKTSASL
jgi:hypothetical protein